jgi:hypothetical protein
MKMDGLYLKMKEENQMSWSCPVFEGFAEKQ